MKQAPSSEQVRPHNLEKLFKRDYAKKQVVGAFRKNIFVN